MNAGRKRWVFKGGLAKQRADTILTIQSDFARTRSVCLILLPGATNPSENGLSVLPKALQARQQRVAQLVGAAVALI
ncbi:MAG TPA: hypothetical protein PLP58_13345, partial [Prosthecobacter sp.]|nr:hypothetical protein [Prosthecobacter sp.]